MCKDPIYVYTRTIYIITHIIKHTCINLLLDFCENLSVEFSHYVYIVSFKELTILQNLRVLSMCSVL